MMQKIHATAIVSDLAKIGLGVEIGAFSIIGDNVTIGDGTIIKSHVVIDGDAVIGKNNTIFPFATIGLEPQDLKFKGERSKVVIGDNNIIREHVTIHLGTQDGGMITRIGNDCLFMVGSHVAHDCSIGNHVVLANNATLAGHVTVDDNVIIGGLSAVHQFVRIGKGVMIGGMSGVEHDVIPYGLVMGERASLAGLNLVGMKRSKLDREDINDLRHFFKEISQKDLNSFEQRVEISAQKFDSTVVKEVLEFVRLKGSRAFCQIKEAA